MAINMLQLRSLIPDDEEFFRILNDDSMKIFFSQFGEELAVFEILVKLGRSLHTGFYVDIGAFHPNYYSNTRLLHILGWNGINIDANKYSLQEFENSRPKDINIFCAAGTEDNESCYYRFSGGAANTLCKPVADQWKGHTGFNYIGEECVPVQNVNTLLREVLPSGQRIDYLNVDIEGMDRSVLEILDLEEFRPSILSVELLDADKMWLGRDRTVSRIIEHEYEFANVYGPTYIFSDLRLQH